MQYAERLPNPRVMVVPIVALAIGAAAATGTYALVDGTGADVQPTHVIVADTPAQPGQGVAAKNEAANAAAIGNPVPSSTSLAKNEAETPGTAEARKQVEIGRSITDPDEYRAFVKSLADYDHARGYGDKR
jgi:hypothetical protein